MIRRLTEEDLPRLQQFWTRHWGSDFIVAHGEVINYDEVEGFILEDWIGLVTFRIFRGECEIVSLDSLQSNKGNGTLLLNAIVAEARKTKCRVIWLITTNDNLNALGFYQKRGFELVTINRGVIDQARKIKPSISLIGMNNIPIRDEIVLGLEL